MIQSFAITRWMTCVIQYINFLGWPFLFPFFCHCLWWWCWPRNWLHSIPPARHNPHKDRLISMENQSSPSPGEVTGIYNWFSVVMLFKGRGIAFCDFKSAYMICKAAWNLSLNLVERKTIKPTSAPISIPCRTKLNDFYCSGPTKRGQVTPCLIPSSP